MLTSRIAASARAAMVCACIGLTAVSCGSAPGAPSSSGGDSHSNPPPTQAAGPSPSTAAGVYGDPTVAAKYWQQQSLEDNCGLVSVADVVGEITGHAPTEQQLVAMAESTPSSINPGPIYAPRDDPSHSGANGGIEMADEVVLLDHYGIKSEMTSAEHPDQTGLPALQQYLAADRKAIAWVNSALIWNTSDQRTKADHFLVVTGIDTGKEIVHLNDPGADHPDEQISIGAFTAAWQTGEESLVVTAAGSDRRRLRRN
jgi:peptidase C39-like protein